ncbi:hypothetical protein B0H11DRAFT_2245124 [Mycena galericulata]|nr:hypothetical protein B0H11DRAFT_2247900 [Mycena galericulata]KAJ7454002.1 hypothetical protein B0H11DRAFT_2245124 [Mycena galericulata]
MLQTLAAELLLELASLTPSLNDVKALALTCRWIHRSVAPLLFRRIRIHRSKVQQLATRLATSPFPWIHSLYIHGSAAALESIKFLFPCLVEFSCMVQPGECHDKERGWVPTFLRAHRALRIVRIRVAMDSGPLPSHTDSKLISLPHLSELEAPLSIFHSLQESTISSAVAREQLSLQHFDDEWSLTVRHLTFGLNFHGASEGEIVCVAKDVGRVLQGRFIELRHLSILVGGWNAEFEINIPNGMQGGLHHLETFECGLDRTDADAGYYGWEYMDILTSWRRKCQMMTMIRIGNWRSDWDGNTWKEAESNGDLPEDSEEED